MLRKMLLSVLATVVLCCASVAAQEKSLTLDEVIAKHLQARGGADKIKAVKSVKVSGKVLVQGGAMEIPMTMQIKRPSMMRNESTLQGKSMIQAFDGTNGWSVSPFRGNADPEPMPEEQIKRLKKQGNLMDGMLIDYKDKGRTIELVGKEDVEGTPAYKLKITDADGDVTHVYLDAENFLELKSTAKSKQRDQEIEMDTFYGDYKEVNGLIMPFSIENKAKGAGPSSQVVIEKIELDVEMDDAIFKMPAKAADKTPEKK